MNKYVKRKILIQEIMKLLNLDNYFTANSIFQDIIYKFNIDKINYTKKRYLYNYEEFMKVFYDVYNETIDTIQKYVAVDNLNLTEKK